MIFNLLSHIGSIEPLFFSEGTVVVNMKKIILCVLFFNQLFSKNKKNNNKIY